MSIFAEGVVHVHVAEHYNYIIIKNNKKTFQIEDVGRSKPKKYTRSGGIQDV